MRVLVTGGCGFIGANFLNLAASRYPDWDFINIDKMTYAANPLSIVMVSGIQEILELGEGTLFS